MSSPAVQVLFLFLLSPLHASAELLGKLKIDFDDKLEGRTGLHEVIEDVVGDLSLATKRKVKDEDNFDDGAFTERDLFAISPNGMGAVGDLEKRQYCDSGYGYCADFDGCCPSNNKCCSYGYCILPGRSCCLGGSCDGDEDCCGTNYCMPSGSQCCSDGTHCPKGNNCYTVEGYSDMRCCTNDRCTAYVDEYGTTSSASTSTTTRTYTTTSTQYYYWTVTWWYYYYYWSYSIAIEASVVTSSRTTTSSTLSIRTTDSAAAEEYFSSLSSELTLPTPASATSLESLADETSYVGETSSTEDTEQLPSPAPTSSDVVGGFGDNDGVGGDGPPVVDNTAQALLSSVDGFTAAFLSFGIGVGVLAVML